jgi:hypothetical protein
MFILTYQVLSIKYQHVIRMIECGLLVRDTKIAYVEKSVVWILDLRLSVLKPGS